jgi:hypothetical protein
MLGVNIPKDLENWSHDKLRYYLLFQTAGMRQLVDNLRKKHNFNPEKKHELESKLAWSSNDGNLKNELETLVNDLGIARDFIDYSILNDDIDEPFLDGLSIPVYIATSVRPLTSGFFIKIDQSTTQTKVLEAFREVQEMMKHFNQYIQKKKNHYAPAKKETRLSNLSQAIKITLLIEKELINGKSVTESIGTIAEIVYPEELESELQTKTNAEKTQERYYDILRYYHIPTPLQFKKLASKYSLTKK